ncbi:MAG: type IX secretion system sortase PorU [Bacteroidales bacterium]|nr:type IX secretion system sortase PorU [Bacteroidales bacterium]
MRNKILKIVFAGVLALLFNVGLAQNNTYTSVLSEHSWYRLSVTKEGIYKLDYATLQAMGVDMNTLNPNKIRIFGNPSGALPEKNSRTRPDDLTEMAIFVEGAEDGTFDQGDAVLFYGQEPTRWRMVNSSGNTYARERNYYTDTTYYYLCPDGGVNGLRVGEKPSLDVESATTVIYEFPDFVWHEEELFSPYSLGQNWFGERLAMEDSLLSLQFHFPNLAKNKPLKVKSKVFGRINGTMQYDAWLNDAHIADGVAITKPGDNHYARPSSVESQVLSDSDTLVFNLSIRNNAQATLYLDFVEIYGWRQLKRVGSVFPFRLLPTQFGNGQSAVWIQNTSSQYLLWDVTAPMTPVKQVGVHSGGNMVFATNETTEKRYVLFHPQEVFEVDHWQAIPNQNVHAIADADMLILTSSIFMEQAQALADYHTEKDGLNSIVVDVNEIYNEFSTGVPDPTGIRDFVRMVYLRSAGNLKYLTLFGKASFDFRNIQGAGQNYVPCYETMSNPEYELSFCTDDYYGLMDNEEGVNCNGKVDLGIGRISVTTVEEAETVLKKIKHSDDLAAVHGDWKTNLLLFADDEQSSYIENSETYYKMSDTLCPPLTAKKVYCGAYPVVNTTSGVEIPGANADIMRALSDGALVMLYTGHGGVKGLTGDNVFTNSDIAELRNYDKMPFIFTATCEFAKYDNPLLVSAGELMLLSPRGGTVAMLTACRPTVGFNNVKLGKALMIVLYQREREGGALRFGDIIRMAKADSDNYTISAPMENKNISFVFLGDPAMRLALPEESVKVQKINGMEVGAGEVGLHSMSMVTLEGEVRNIEGVLDTQFNGELWMKFYEKKSKVKVKYSNSSTNVYYHRDVLYHGRVDVKNGKFSVSFQVPENIRLENGNPRFSFYAYDSIRNKDAMGSFDQLVLGGVDPAAVADDQGPNIKFYWNSPDFIDGEHVERQGVLYAELYDAQGIYHYDYSLGRDIVLSSNNMIYNNLVLNDSYEPALNDFRRGRVAIPVTDLDAGTYEFKLKVWDTQNNASEASLWFVVDEDMFLSKVCNYPNPFTDETRIILSHTGEDGIFDVNIEIFDIMGRQVQQLYKRVAASNGVVEPILWNGCDYLGNPLQSGIYIYRLTLTDESGYFRTVSQRMVIRR